jgi:peptidoglycan/xylan/chitin deacetylase (PgdA/CDA1 family)
MLSAAGRVDEVEASGGQERMGASAFDPGAQREADGHAAMEASGNAEGVSPDAPTTPIDGPAAAYVPESPEEQPFPALEASASFAADEDALHSQPTDLSLIAIGGAQIGDVAPAEAERLAPRRRSPLVFPRGRLALLAPLAAALLIVGVVLSGLGLQGANIANLVSVPFLAARAHATPTRAPTSTITPVYNTPTPRTPTPRERARQLNAAMGCVNGAPPALTKPIYTSKNFLPGAPTPNEVALTFDDGPTPYTTPPILDYLEQNHVPATFFVEGSYARIWPYLVQREWNDGFAIGMHSWDHPVLTILPDSQMPHQFGESLDAIHAAIGKDACIWFWRPPYGSYNPRILGIAQSYGLTTVMWDDDSVDYSRPGPQQIAATVLSEAHPGAVILMHDGPARREQTLAALPLILAGLKARGLTPVTLPQLLADSLYPGVDTVLYSGRNKPDLTT